MAVCEINTWLLDYHFTWKGAQLFIAGDWCLLSEILKLPLHLRVTSFWLLEASGRW